MTIRRHFCLNMAPLDGMQNGRDEGRLKVMQSERALTVGGGVFVEMCDGCRVCKCIR